MTAGPSAGPSSAYPTLRRPASICFKERNDVFVPGLIAGSCAGLVVFCCAPAEPMMPSCAAAMLVAAAPRKRRRSWLMPATVPISSIMSLPRSRAVGTDTRARLRTVSSIAVLLETTCGQSCRPFACSAIGPSEEHGHTNVWSAARPTYMRLLRRCRRSRVRRKASESLLSRCRRELIVGSLDEMGMCRVAAPKKRGSVPPDGPHSSAREFSGCRRRGAQRSPKRERKNLRARPEKLDFELAIGDGLRLSDQLVQTLLGDRAVALFININTVSRAWRLSIDQHAKSHGRCRRSRAHDEMKIAGVKTVRDASIGLVQGGGFLLHCPVARQRPSIQPQRRRQFVHARLIRCRSAWRRKVLGAPVSDIIFRRFEAAPIGGHFETECIDRHQVITSAAGSGLHQQSLNHHFRLWIRAFAEVWMPNTSLRIAEIQRRPILVPEGSPYDMLAVDCDRIVNPQFLHGPADVVDVFLE